MIDRLSGAEATMLSSRMIAGAALVAGMALAMTAGVITNWASHWIVYAVVGAAGFNIVTRVLREAADDQLRDQQMRNHDQT